MADKNRKIYLNSLKLVTRGLLGVYLVTTFWEIEHITSVGILYS